MYNETNFIDFKVAIQRKFNEIKSLNLFRTEIDKDKLWDLYLTSFPEGTNPIYKTRTEHDCQCCRSFIRTVGNMVAIVDGKLISIWDINIGGFYQVVADALSSYVKSNPIDNIFLHVEGSSGVDKNYQEVLVGEDKTVLTWNHFHIQLPSNLVNKDPGSKLSECRSTKDVMIRSLREITADSIETVLDLISQNSIYRGEEHKSSIEEFFKLKKRFDKIKSEEQDLFCWSVINSVHSSVSRFRSTVIGTLLSDLSEGRELEAAVASFEAKVAPTNYKRPTSLITKSMIESAKEKIDELGYTSSLERRFAVLEDISINNVLFADRTAKKRMNNVFDELSSKISDNKNFDEVEEVHIDKFISDILPGIDSIELLFDNSHVNNLVSLIAPCDLTAPGMFKWGNNFSWSYTGELTDSIKERVKSAGGKVDGDLRCSLSWFNYDDLDLHMIEPSGERIYFNHRISPATSGNLDVDMNANSGKTRSAVENICYPNKNRMAEGVYKLLVNQFCKRESIDCGFDIEIEFDGKVNSIHYSNPVKNNEYVTVAEIKYTHKNGFEIISSLPSKQSSKVVWFIPTQTFHKVSVLMLSPNHWDGKSIGNKHYFFMIENCLNDGKARGFFNEFLKDELSVHRKVLEVVGSKMKTEESLNQLSGIGFSSTKRDSLICRVKGNFTRVIKVLF